MTSPISSHYSFIVRCWRDANGTLRGWVVDVLTQRSYPFAMQSEMNAHIENLTQDPPPNELPAMNNRPLA